MTVASGHLVGREDELQAVLGLLETPGLLPGTVALAGEAGIGKTTVWLAAVTAAQELDYRVLSSRPAEAETGFSFAGLTDLLGDAVGEALPGLPAPQRRALEAALLLADADEQGADERSVALAFLNTLRALARARPLVVAVDDVQWLDPPSSAVVRFALARLHDEPVAALFACRGVVPEWLRRASSEKLLEVDVGPLSLGALHELFRTRLDRTFARPTLLRLWETSGGNPFFALELARALERRGGRVEPGEELPIPRTLDELLAERLDALTPQAADVARVVAALAEPTLDLVRVAAGSSASTGVSDGVAARVLDVDGDRIRFSHPLLASAVSARTPPDARRAVHRRLAAVVADEEQRARHLAMAAPAADAAVADVLEAAARRAGARGAAAGAADLAEQALRLTPPTDEAAVRRRRVETADRLFHAGDSARTILLLEEALVDLAPGPARAAVLRRLAAARSQVTGPRAGVALFREALAQSGGDAALEAAIHLELADILRFESGIRSAEPHAEAAVRAAERAGDGELLAKALAVFGLVHFKLGRGIEQAVMARAVELEESLGLSAGTWGAKTVLLDQLFWSHELGAARALAVELAEASRRREDPFEAEHLWYLAMTEWRAGNWARAAELAELTQALDEQRGHEGFSPVNEWPRAIVAAHRGLVEDARARSETALARAEAAGIGTAQAAHRWVLGFLELSLGRPETALAHLRPAHELRRAVGHAEPNQHWELADLVAALVEVGELDEAASALAPTEERARALDRGWALAVIARGRGLIRAAQADIGGSLACFADALGNHARALDPFQLARTLLAMGAVQRRAKQRGAARETLTESLRLFEELGAPLWAAQARVELARIGGRAASRDELTPSERRIAALVAEGRTNREVAAALFVTEHTVEAALTRAYRKLGVRSRTELAHRLRAAST